jgi:hypothetical protein
LLLFQALKEEKKTTQDTMFYCEIPPKTLRHEISRLLEKYQDVPVVNALKEREREQ